jgi:flagellar biosynthesis/type III secretory pathway protein FliH
LSNSQIFRGDVPFQTFASMLPTVVPSALQVAVKREGRGGRTANEIEQLKQASMNDGYDEGYARGLEIGINEGNERAYADAYAKADAEANARNNQMISDFSQDLDITIASILKALEDWSSSAEQKLTEMVTDIAKQVIIADLQISREATLAIVKSAVTEVTHSGKARIRLNPVDSKQMELHRAEIIASSQSIRALEFVEDSAILGGCVIETEGGIVDATVEGKLAQLDCELGEAA